MDSKSRLGHMFRDAPGHLKKDTPENRAYILAAISDPLNKVGENKFGREIYCKIMPDGYRAWAHVEKGFIINGGRDTPWKKWEPSPDEYLGGRMLPIPVTIFGEQIQIDRLTNIFNSTIAESHWEPHPLETITVARYVGGVRHETGIIIVFSNASFNVSSAFFCSCSFLLAQYREALFLLGIHRKDLRSTSIPT